MIDQHVLHFLDDDDATTYRLRDKKLWLYFKRVVTTKLGRITDQHAPPYLAGDDISTCSSCDKHL